VGPIHACGLLVLTVTASVVHSRLLAPERYNLLADQRFLWWTMFTFVLMASAYAFGLPGLAASRLGAVARAESAVLVSFATIALVQSALATPLLPRSALGLVALTVPIWAVLTWNLSDDVLHWDAKRDRLFVVVSNPEDLASLEADLANRPERPATIVGHMFVDDILVRPSAAALVHRFHQSNATMLVMDSASHSFGAVIEQATQIHRSGYRIRTLALFYEEWIGKLPHSELARVSLLFDVGELHRRRYVQAKRVVDLAFAAIGLLFLAPVLLVVAMLNPIWNAGPLLYKQPRIGKNGKPFTIFKLRTMRPSQSSDEGGTEWTTTGDARITALGRWLRRSHLDELPQVINILNGDLSLVGPRPEQPHYVEQLGEKIEFFDVRHIVRPGITGWAQVKQGYVADDDASFDKLQYDFYYLRRQGLRLDAWIIWRTIRGVMAGDGR
jgi:lipopolysaccharide/colanic/teichoic acid biosynthesis glycosyltransferase